MRSALGEVTSVVGVEATLSAGKSVSVVTCYSSVIFHFFGGSHKCCRGRGDTECGEIGQCRDLSFISQIPLLCRFAADAPQWGAADAEIKVPFGENTELKLSPFKAWSRSVSSHTCYAFYQGFLP